MSSLLIRKYTESDRTSVLNIFKKNVPEYFGENEIHDLKIHLDEHGSSYFVASIGKKIVGAGGYYFVDNQQARLSWYFIDPSSYNKGIGKNLVNHSLRCIEKTNCAHIQVWTSQFASDFFSKFGFVLKAQKENYWAPGIHLYKMEKSRIK